MNTEQIYAHLLKSNGGAKYYKCDFHIHTPFSYDWRGLKIPLEEYFEKLEEYEYDIIITADHGYDTVRFWEEYLKIKDSINISVFPGSEITLTDNSHITLIFSPEIEPDEIETILNNLNVNKRDHSVKWDLSKKDWVEIAKNLCPLIIIPHANWDKGVWKETDGQKRKNIFGDPIGTLINFPQEKKPDVQIKHPNCSIFNLDYLIDPKETEEIEKRTNRIKKLERRNCGYPVALESPSRFGFIKISDAHNLEMIDKINSECTICQHSKFCHKGFNWIKLSEISIKGLSQLSYDSGNRIKLLKPVSEPKYQILGMYIEDGFFKEEIFTFNPWLNVLIGGRGTGKSLSFELIQMVFDQIPDEDFERKNFDTKIAETLPVNKKVEVFVKSKEGDIWAFSRSYTRSQKKKKGNFKYNILSYSTPKANQWNAITKKFDRKKDLPEIYYSLEILAQTKVTSLCKKDYNNLIKYVDDFIPKSAKIDFSNLDEINEEFTKKKEDYILLCKKFLADVSNLIELEEKDKRLNELERLTKGILFENNEQWEISNTCVKNLSAFMKNFDSKIEDVIAEPIPTFPDIQPEFKNLAQFREIYDLSNDLIKKLGDTYLKEKLKLSDKFSSLSKKILEWEAEYKINKDEFQENLRKTGKESQEDIANEKIILIKEIEKISDLKLTIDTNAENLRKFPAELKDFCSRKFDIQKKILNSRIESAKKMKNAIKDNRIFIKIKNHDTSLWESYLKSINTSLLDEIIQEQPVNFLKLIVDSTDKSNFLDNFIKPKAALIRDIYSIYNDNWKNIINFEQMDLADKQIFEKKFETYNIHLIPEKILDIFEIPYPDAIIIQLEKGGRNRDILNASWGEKISVILSIIMQDLDKILLIDQPDSELDYESIGSFITTILLKKHQRQIVFITHNPNIPALGDADQIIFLEHKYDPTDLEHGYIEKAGGFENMIEKILKLEGGPNAIKNRIRKYLIDKEEI